MRRTRKWKRSNWIALAAIYFIAFCIVGPFLFEPTDKPRFEDVTITSYRKGTRGSQYFTVVSAQSGKSWEIGAARGPYPPEYRGPAVLAISRGRWTGRNHYRLLEKGTSTNQPGILLESTNVAH